MKRKIIAIIIILSIILSALQPIILADDGGQKGISQDTYNSISQEGTASVQSRGKSSMESLSYSISGGDVVAGALVNIVNIIFTAVQGLLSAAITENVTSIQSFSIYKVVFNDIRMFDANYLLDNGNTNNIHVAIKEKVSVWYYNIRNLAIILSLLVLIYIGIRMALSTIASDKARYKKMLISWVESFILIFFLHYLIIISMYLAQTMLDIIRQLAGEGLVLESSLMVTAFFGTVINSGWDCVPWGLMYWVLVYYQVKFFWLYMKRMLSIAFLIIISPLITITYSIDKAGDGRAQAFNAWVKEFEVNMFVQPLHALLYVMFVVTAGAIAFKAPLLYAMFLMALSRGEKIVKGIFSARGMKSIKSMGKGKGKKIL